MCPHIWAGRLHYDSEVDWGELYVALAFHKPSALAHLCWRACMLPCCLPHVPTLAPARVSSLCPFPHPLVFPAVVRAHLA